MNEDLKQYITNLLYYAYAFEKDEKLYTSVEFDEWVEENVDLIDDFFKNEKALNGTNDKNIS